jgi:hypothetical protein
LIETVEDDSQATSRLQASFSPLMMKKHFSSQITMDNVAKVINYPAIISDFERDIFKKNGFVSFISIRSYAVSMLCTDTM